MQEDNRNNISYVMLYCPCSSLDEAKRIAKVLVEGKAVACANIIKNVTSIYRWENELQEDDEVILLAKSLVSKKEEIARIISEKHSYDLPAIVFYKLDSANSEYLDWIRNECK
ncbi:MAG: divalent-cation tolerance protein CutA [Candidatus Hodarchaeales archaeon]